MSFDPRGPRTPKRLSRLLPAEQAAASESSSSAAGHAVQQEFGPLFGDRSLAPKRPRVGVPIACDRCRTKKIRCNGEKPICSSCQRKAIFECHYEDPVTKDTKAGYLIEAIGLLNCLPPDQLSPTLLSLIDLERDVEVITTLRDLAKIAAQPTVALPGAETTFTRMLETKHPFTYPVFEPIDPNEPSNHLKRLVTPRTRVLYEHENMPSHPDKARRDDSQETADARQLAPAPGQPPRATALDGLDMTKWTTVPVSNDFAARAISMYLMTDHRLLCPFDRKPFTKSLVQPELHAYCTPSLVNALMYWCCQMYSSIDPDSVRLAELFRVEAERLLSVETQAATALSMTTEMFLNLGYIVQGKDHASVRHLSNASKIAIELGLFGVPEEVTQAALELMTEEERRAAAYPTWGVFNWTVLMSLFYRQQGVVYPQHPPAIPIPYDTADYREEADQNSQGEPESWDQKQYAVFPPLCEFWKIMHEVTTVFYGNQTASVRQTVSLQFAEFKYRELLAWADALPMILARSGQAQDVVIIIHLWLHSAILDIFRPFVQMRSENGSQQRLKTFSAMICTPDLAYDASVYQLKQLVITYRSKYTSSNYTIIWQTALLYTANAMLRSTDEDRLEYFLICIYSFQGLRQCFRVTEAIVQALLAMAMQQGIVSGTLARTILGDLKRRAPEGEQSDEATIRAPFMANLELSMSDPASATVEELAEQFDESFDFVRYTMLFDQD